MENEERPFPLFLIINNKAPGNKLSPGVFSSAVYRTCNAMRRPQFATFRTPLTTPGHQAIMSTPQAFLYPLAVDSGGRHGYLSPHYQDSRLSGPAGWLAEYNTRQAAGLITLLWEISGTVTRVSW